MSTKNALAEAPKQFLYSPGDFGGIGIFQTRTARFSPDAQLDVGFSNVFPYERYLITLQPLPFIEATFRYTSVENRSYDTNAFEEGGGSAFKDRGADLKFLLAKETEWTPQVAIGIQDGLGTGVFAGEYLAFSKRAFDLDFTLGLGWGYLAGNSTMKNPLTNISPLFATRGGGTTRGGTLLPQSWFSGTTMGFFGGVEYATPLKGLVLKAEYDPNDYLSEPLNNSDFDPAKSHINFGFTYQPFPWINFGLAYERGNTVMFHTTLRANLHKPGLPKFDPPPVKLVVRATPSSKPVGTPLLESAVFRFQDVTPDEQSRGENINLLLGHLDEFGVIDIGIFENSMIVDLERLPNDQAARVAASFAFASDSSIESAAFASLASKEPPVIVDRHETSIYDAATSLETRYAQDGPNPKLLNRQSFAAAVFEGLAKERIYVQAVDLTLHRATAFVSGGSFRQQARNIGRAARVVASAAPDSVEEIEIVLWSPMGELGRVTTRRKDLEAASISEGSSDEIWFGAQVTGPLNKIPSTAVTNPNRYPLFVYSLRPSIRQHIGSREQFYLYEVFLSLSAGVQITPQLSFNAAVGKELYTNLDKLEQEPVDSLPRVRSDIKEYLQQGVDSITRLQGSYMWSPAPNIYARFTAGYLEEMYGGYTGELLYRPFEGRFSVGFDLNYVRQREFDQLFDFRDYTVLTGHLNTYYHFPAYNIHTSAHIGQFLAGDRGVSFNVSRSFDSGVQVGGFATFTDVPFEVFGEGSFDKGFFLSIPFDLFSTRSSTAGGAIAFRPLTKDGGQMVRSDPRLYDVTSGGTLDAISSDWDRVLD